MPWSARPECSSWPLTMQRLVHESSPCWHVQETVDIVVDRSIAGTYVNQVPDQAAAFRGLPKGIRTASMGHYEKIASTSMVYESRHARSEIAHGDVFTMRSDRIRRWVVWCRPNLPPTGGRNSPRDLALGGG